MIDPLPPPTAPPATRPQGVRERATEQGRHPEGVAAERPSFGRRCINGHPCGVPSPRLGPAARSGAHTIRTPAVRQSKSKAELMQ